MVSNLAVHHVSNLVSIHFASYGAKLDTITAVDPTITLHIAQIGKLVFVKRRILTPSPSVCYVGGLQEPSYLDSCKETAKKSPNFVIKIAGKNTPG